MKKKQQNTTQESTKLSQTSWNGCNVSGFTQPLSQNLNLSEQLTYYVGLIQVSQSSHNDDWLGYDRTF